MLYQQYSNVYEIEILRKCAVGSWQLAIGSWQGALGSGDIQNFFKVGGVVGVGAEVGVDGGFFEGLGLLLDVLAVKTIETAEVCLKLTTDILEIT